MQQNNRVLSKTGTFPDILRRERALRGWSQADVAARIGSDPKTVGRWERGRTIPSLYLCQRLSDLYEKTVQELGSIEMASEEALSANKSSTGSTPTAENPPTGETGSEHLPVPVVVIQADTKLIPASLSSPWRGAFRFRFGGKGKIRRTFLVCSLSTICLLALGIGVWWPLHKEQVQATSNPYTGQGTLVFNNSLRADTAAGWSLQPTDEGQCFFADGAYRIRGIKSGYMKLCLASQTYFTNFTYEVKVQVIAGDCGGVAFRTIFPQLYYFLICQDGKYRFVRYDRDNVQNRRIIASGVSLAVQRGLNKVNVIAVVAQGNTFTLYINHTRLYQGTDGAYLDGQIGLIVHTCSIVYLDSRPNVCAVPVEVAFRDARVWSSNS